MKARALLSLTTIALLAVPAFAGTITYDTSAATIVCNTLTGTVGPKPALTLGAQPNTVLKVKAALAGCSVTGAIPSDPPLQVTSGKMSATFTVTGDASCAALAYGFQVAGSLNFKWKPASGQALDHSSTTFTPDASGLVSALIPLGTGTYGAFTIAGTLGLESAFAGATPAVVVISSEDIYNMYGQCCTDPTSCSPVGKGIKKLHFGIGQIQM